MQFEEERKFYQTGDGNLAYFEWVAMPNKFMSEKEGRPIFDQALRMSVVSKGQQKSTFSKVVLRKPSNGEERRDTVAWQKYGKIIQSFIDDNEDGRMTGTPLESWKEINIARAASLRALNVYTVEQLAELDDHGLQNIGMGGRELQAKAKKYIESTKSEAGIVNAMKEAQAKNTELEARIAELEEQLEASSEKEEKPKRKRRKKA